MVNDLVLALILAVIQGATEWFPISSSGHLVLFEGVLGYEGGLLFDVALHFGTLMAVFVYFGRDITDILRDLFLGKWNTENGRLGLLLIVASVPAAIAGFFVRDIFTSVLSNIGVVAFGFGISGLFLIIASMDIGRRTDIGKMGFGKAFFIGIAQAISLVPGISRSGASISSGVLFGLNEKNAMKFAFLMSVPVIFGANILAIGNQTFPTEMIWGTLVSFIIGLVSIHVVFKHVLVNRKNFRWFGLYCLLLAVVLGVWILF